MELKISVEDKHISAFLSLLKELRYVKIQEVQSSKSDTLSVVEDTEAVYDLSDDAHFEASANIRPLLAYSNAFEFWEDEREDLYQDFAK